MFFSFHTSLQALGIHAQCERHTCLVEKGETRADVDLVEKGEARPEVGRGSERGGDRL